MQQRRRSFLLSAVAAGGVIAAGESNGSAGPCRNRYIFCVAASSPRTALTFYKREGLMVLVEVVPGGGTKGVQALPGGSADVVAGYYDHSVRMGAQGQAGASM